MTSDNSYTKTEVDNLIADLSNSINEDLLQNTETLSVTNKGATIGTTETVIATIDGVDITARVSTTSSNPVSITQEHTPN
jgi:hypothetical protein